MTDTADLTTAELIEKAREEADALTFAIGPEAIAWQREGGLERAILLRALADRLEAAERERDEFGPYFVRDMARLVALPDNASMDDTAKSIRARIRRDARVVEAAQKHIEDTMTPSQSAAS